MRHIILIFIASLTLSCGLSQNNSKLVMTPEHNKIFWYEGQNTIYELAQNNDKPVLLYLHSPYCHWCERFEEETLINVNVTKFVFNHYIPVSLDMSKKNDLNRYLGKNDSIAVPALIVLNNDGLFLEMMVGSQDSEQTLKFLKSSLNSYELEKTKPNSYLKL